MGLRVGCVRSSVSTLPFPLQAWPAGPSQARPSRPSHPSPSHPYPIPASMLSPADVPSRLAAGSFVSASDFGSTQYWTLFTTLPSTTHNIDCSLPLGGSKDLSNPSPGPTRESRQRLVDPLRRTPRKLDRKAVALATVNLQGFFLAQSGSCSVARPSPQFAPKNPPNQQLTPIICSEFLLEGLDLVMPTRCPGRHEEGGAVARQDVGRQRAATSLLQVFCYSSPLHYIA